MCDPHRKGVEVRVVWYGCVLGLFLLPACSPQPTSSIIDATPASIRAERRAFEGAPPVIPHPPLNGKCVVCHSATGQETPGVGLAPANPHLQTPGMQGDLNCRQCHVFRQTNLTLRDNHFRGWTLVSLRGERLNPSAPPVLPHGTFMRENCQACHATLAARPELRCKHSERLNCLQCHAKRGAD